MQIKSNTAKTSIPRTQSLIYHASRRLWWSNVVSATSNSSNPIVSYTFHNETIRSTMPVINVYDGYLHCISVLFLKKISMFHFKWEAADSVGFTALQIWKLQHVSMMHLIINTIKHAASCVSVNCELDRSNVAAHNLFAHVMLPPNVMNVPSTIRRSDVHSFRETIQLWHRPNFGDQTIKYFTT